MSPKRQADELLSTNDAAKILGVTPDNIRYLERRGKLKAEYTHSGQRIFRRGDVEAAARARDVTGELLEPPGDAA